MSQATNQPMYKNKEQFFKQCNTPEAEICHLAYFTNMLSQGMIDLWNDNSPPLRGSKERRRITIAARHLRTIGDAIKQIDYIPLWEILNVSVPKLTGKGGLVTLSDRVSHRSVGEINKKLQDEAVEAVLSLAGNLTVAVHTELLENGLPTDKTIHAGSDLQFEDDDQQRVSTPNVVGMDKEGGLHAALISQNGVIIYCSPSELRKIHPVVEVIGKIPSTTLVLSSKVGTFLFPETHYRLESPEWDIPKGKLQDSDTGVTF